MRLAAILLFVMIVGSANLAAAVIDAVPPEVHAAEVAVADKTRALASLDLSIKTTEGRQVTLKKNQERLKARLASLEATQAEVKKAKDAFDQAEAATNASKHLEVGPGGKVMEVTDMKLLNAQGVAQKAWNAAKKDAIGIDEEQAQLKAQQEIFDQQQDTLAKRLEAQTADREKAAAALDDAKAKLAALKAGDAALTAPAQ